jgi:phosphatidylglycerophosphate synthase
MAAAAAFLWGSLGLGALLSIAGFFLDGIDGKVARLRNIDQELHGTLDFLCDQSAFAAMALAVVSWTSRTNRLSAGLGVCLWLAAYMLLMAFTSTWFRLLLQSGSTDHHGAARRTLTAAVDAGDTGWLATPLAFLLRTFTTVNTFMRRYRMLPYPGAIESEVMVFMVAPLLHFNWVVVLAGTVLLLPDIAINLIMNVTTVLRRRSRDG